MRVAVADNNFSEYLKKYMFSDAPAELFPLAPRRTKLEYFDYGGDKIIKYINEFWTAKQRRANSIHEISYRACFKAQLPAFFIKLLTKEGDVVYDPFAGRGTAVIEAALLNRNIIANDINPLSALISHPRLFIPELIEIRERLYSIDFDYSAKADMDLSMFYHNKTEAEIISLREYLINREHTGETDDIDSWIRMIATNRLTGHSKGFFSVYTLPPNQAVLPERQKKINKERNQMPGYRDIRKIILSKSKSLLRNVDRELVTRLKKIGRGALFLSNDARKTKRIQDNTVALTVTSPPFLDVVQYGEDNWLRCWFNDIDIKNVEKKITMAKKIEDWQQVMAGVFKELFRVTKLNGWVAFEVGEIRGGKIKLEEYVVPLGLNAGFSCKGIMINSQLFSKTSNCWGVKNNKNGTNTNRIIIFQKESL